MCGVAGFWDREEDPRVLSAIARRMADVIAHRGPDDHGSWVDEEAGIGFGHRRLSIVDLSPLGHQPMISAGGRYVITFNGEVYNHTDLRRDLSASSTAAVFRGHSDTEVMLAAIEAWGLEAAASRFVGMFAFALWDRQKRLLHLVRDRLGIKPLYYGWAGDTLLFASEMKSFSAHPRFHGEIDRDAITLVMRLGNVPAPYCIYRGFRKVLPGTIVTIADPTTREARTLTYWSAAEIVERGLADPFRGNDREAADRLEVLLREAIALRMRADVPLGAFLSGGVDSSTVVALMQAQSGRPVRTFSIGFADDDYNEAHHARAVAEHLRTDHTELYVSPEDAQNVIPTLPVLYDEPFADSSQIPTFIVSELARRHVTIALSGDGGDELFAGYNRHVWASRLWRATRTVPLRVRAAGSRAIGAVSPDEWDRFFRFVRHALPQRLAHSTPGVKLHKIADALSAASPEAVYQCLASEWETPTSFVLGAVEPRTQVTDRVRQPALRHPLDRMLYLDLVGYLPDDILTKLDRASMAVSLEGRVPLLDHRVVEFAWTLPRSMKVRRGQSKWILRQVLQRYVPTELIDRPKSGFAVPLDDWLRGPLRAWAETLLDARRLRDEGFLDAATVRDHWAAHQSGRRNFGGKLWNVLMFQAWLEARRNEARAGSAPLRRSVAGVVA